MTDLPGGVLALLHGDTDTVLPGLVVALRLLVGINSSADLLSHSLALSLIAGRLVEVRLLLTVFYLVLQVFSCTVPQTSLLTVSQVSAWLVLQRTSLTEKHCWCLVTSSLV